MYKAKTFLYVSLGILALAGAFHLGASSAHGQAPSGPVAVWIGSAYVGEPGLGNQTQGVLTSSGDFYSWDGYMQHPARFEGNIFVGMPVRTTETTWGRIKAERR